MKEIKVEAKIENLAVVNGFLHEQIDELDCSVATVMQLEIAIEELFSNICYYAYGDGTGDAAIQVDIDKTNKRICITFIDMGKPYNPLKKADPDITLGIEDRPIGGLGIFMVKESMDDMTYRYAENKNILKIKKKF